MGFNTPPTHFSFNVSILFLPRWEVTMKQGWFYLSKAVNRTVWVRLTSCCQQSVSGQVDQCTFEIVCTEEGTFNFWALEVIFFFFFIFQYYTRSNELSRCRWWTFLALGVGRWCRLPPLECSVDPRITWLREC